MTNISDIFDKFGSRDNGIGTDKTTSHSYGETYNKLFTPIKDDVKSILEIGFCGGFGLKAYSEYFPNATIYGIDITDRWTKDICRNNPKINLLIGDATKYEIINHFNTSYDIIIEDASHNPQHQIRHFQDFHKFVKPGGYYIIEDVDQKYLDAVLGETKKISDVNNFECVVYDLRTIKNRFDDIMIVFRKQFKQEINK